MYKMPTGSKANNRYLDMVKSFLSSDKFSTLEDQATDFVSKNFIPTRSMMMKAYNILFDFIRKKGRIIYGGAAIDILLKMKKDPGVYTSLQFPDIDFYTPTPYKDAIDICNKLQDAGVCYISAHTAEKGTTTKIHIEEARDELADITYVPERVYKYLYQHSTLVCNAKIGTPPYTGLRVISANFQIIDTLNVLVNPESWNKVAKNLEREARLSNMYLVPHSSAKSTRHLKPRFRKENKDMAQIVAFARQSSSGGITAGIQVYNNLIRRIKGGQRHAIYGMPFEVYIQDAEKVSDKLLKDLSAKFPKWSFAKKSYFPFLNLINSRYVISATQQGQSRRIAILFDYKDQCMNTKKDAHGNLSLPYWAHLRHCYIMYHRSKLDRDHDWAAAYQYMYTQLRYTHREWCRNRGLKEWMRKDSPFKLLIPTCTPTPDILRFRRKSRLDAKKIWKRNAPGFPKFTYRPEEKKVDAKNVGFNAQLKRYKIGDLFSIDPFHNRTGFEKK